MPHKTKRGARKFPPRNKPIRHALLPLFVLLLRQKQVLLLGGERRKAKTSVLKDVVAAAVMLPRG